MVLKDIRRTTMTRLEQYPGEKIIYVTPSNDGFETPQQAIDDAVDNAKHLYPDAHLFRVGVLTNEDAPTNKKYIAGVYERVKI